MNGYLAILTLVSGGGAVLWAAGHARRKPRAIEDLIPLIDREFASKIEKIDDDFRYSLSEPSLLIEVGGLSGMKHLIGQMRLMNKISSIILELGPDGEFRNENYDLPDLSGAFLISTRVVIEEMMLLFRPGRPRRNAKKLARRFCQLAVLQAHLRSDLSLTYPAMISQ